VHAHGEGVVAGVEDVTAAKGGESGALLLSEWRGSSEEVLVMEDVSKMPCELVLDSACELVLDSAVHEYRLIRTHPLYDAGMGMGVLCVWKETVLKSF
jgi:hypothetical protein